MLCDVYGMALLRHPLRKAVVGELGLCLDGGVDRDWNLI
jgi:hypothetical protein